jgi:hypothetical protein
MPVKTIFYHLQTIVKDAMELFYNIFSTTYGEMEHFNLRNNNNVDKKTSINFSIVDKDNEFLQPNKENLQTNRICKRIIKKNFNSNNLQQRKCYRVELQRISTLNS